MAQVPEGKWPRGKNHPPWHKPASGLSSPLPEVGALGELGTDNSFEEPELGPCADPAGGTILGEAEAEPVCPRDMNRRTSGSGAGSPL